MTAKRRLLVLSFLIFALFPVLASAATIEFRTLIDVDNNAATGCSVAGMTGVEHVVVTVVKTDATSGAVEQSHRLACSGGSLGSPIDVDTSGWPVGFNAASGGMLVENRIAFSTLGGTPSAMRLGFDATSGSSTHSATGTSNGASIIYPESRGRRRAVAAPGGDARFFQLDGNGADWGAIDPVVNGIAGGGTPAIRMIKAYAYANATDEFVYFRVDANSGSDAPFAEDDEYSRAAGQATLAVAAPGVLSNDGDPNGQPITALPVSPAAHGDVTLNADGSFTYSPADPTSSQTDSFQYKATNGAQESNVAKVTIKVSSVANSAPVALNDSQTTGEDQPLNVGAPGVLANDSDPDGDTITATKLTDPSNGSVVVNSDGSFTYTPDLDFFGTDTFTYEVTDGEFTSTATVTITVESVNDAPTVSPDTFSVDENAPNGTPVGTVNMNDVDAGDSHGYAITGGNTGGAFAISNSGQITVANGGAIDFEVTPSYSLTVTVTDNGVPSQSGSATITVTVNDQNEAPVAVNDATTILEDGNVNVVAPGLLANDTDPEGDTLTATKLTNPVNGTATVAANGAWTYQPNANFFGTDSFTYQVSDGTNTSNIATVTITVTSVNDTPSFAGGGNVSSAEDIAFTAGWATAISAGPANESTQTLTFNVTNDNNPLFTVQPAISSTGVLTYTPAANANGTANVTVTLPDDGSGANTSAPQNFTITVTEVNDPPTVTNDATTTPEDVALVMAAATLAANDSAGPANESAQTRTVTGVSATSTQGGTVTLVAGTITYTPAANFNGTDTFTYTVTDNGTTNGAADPQSAVGTVTVTVTEVNDPPATAADGAPTQEDTQLLILASSLATNDSAGPANESSQTLTVTAVSPNSAQGGTVTLVSGTITYTPPANYFGPDSFTYTITDNGTTNGVPAPLTANGTVDVVVGPVNDPPQLTVAGAATHTEGGAATNVATAANITDVDDTNMEAATIQITGNYAGAEDVLSFVNTPQITGTLTGDTLSLTGTDTLANYIAAIQAVQYTNTSDTPSTLQRTLTWTVYDGSDISNTQNTTVDVTATNDGPVNTVPGAQTVAEDTPLTFSTANGNAIAIADADANPDDVQVTLNVANGTVTLNPSAIAALTTLTGDGTGTVVATGTVAEINAALDGMTFTGISQFEGPASIQIVTDDLGNNPSGALTDTDSVAITVTAVNDPPVLSVTGAVTHTEGGAATNLATAANITDVDDTNIESATIQITGNYAGAEDVLSFVNTPQITGAFVGDTLTLTGSDTLANYIAALQAVQYTNTSDAPSTLQRTITWAVNDGDSNSNTQTTTLDVTATNDGPVNTVAAGLSTDEDTPLVINGASIADADAASDDVQITLNVTGGTVTLDATATGALTSLTGDGGATVVATGTVAEINDALGGMTFSPAADTSGTASIQMVTDDLGNNPSGNLNDTDSFNITVNAINDAPVLTVTGAPVTFPENGSPVTPASAVNITDVDDTNIESATVTISANFQALDVLIFANTPNITGNFAGSTLTLTGSDTKANYIAALQSVTFSHGSDAPSEAQRTLTWVVNDGTINSNSQDTTVDVTASNDAPQNTVPAGLATDEDVPLVINGASISDVDADPDDVQITLNVTSGTVTLDATATAALSTLTGDGTATVVATGTVAEINAALSGMTFTPTAEFSGTASIQMVTNDLGNNPSGALQADDTFNITVNNINDAPVLTVSGAPTFAENGSAVAIASAVNITDIDDANIESATITITNVQTGDVLNFVNTPNITGNFAAGVLTLTGSDTKAAYISALQSITFSNASDNPSITQRAITWVVNDGDINSNTQNTTVDVTATNDAPVNTVAVGVTTNEDTPVVINGASIADPDADPDDVQITLNVTSGTVALDPTATGALATLTGDGSATVVATGTVAEINAALSGMTFTPTGNFSGTASIQMVTDDLGNNPSGAIQDTDSFNITVNAVNDPPSFTPGSDVNISEDHGLYSEAAWATSISAGPADENAQGLTMSSVVTGTTGTLSFMTAPSVNVVSGDLNFQANANTCGTATIEVTLTDDAGTPGVPADDLSSTPHTLTIMVACVNDSPSFTKGPDQTVNEDAAAQTINPWATAISPGPGETDALTFNVSNDNNPLFTAGGQPAVSPAGVLTYTPAPNANGTTIVTVTLTDDGGTPGDNSDDITTGPQTFNITVTAVNDAPSFSIAGDPPFIVLSGGAQTVNAYATSITDGDPELTQVLTFNFTQTANTGTLAFDAAPAIDPATGNLTYTPTAGTHGTVTFSVTLSDDGSNAAPNVNVSGAQSFTIAVEKAPEVTSTVPADNASGVSTSTNITVNFDEAVSVTLVPPSFKINCNAGADLAFAYVGGTTNVTTVTLDPTATLPAGNCIVTVVANEVHDTDAYDPPDGLAADFTFDFITNTPPTAVDDNATALGHVTLTVADAQGVLSNDTDPDAGADMDVQNFGTPITTTQGGTITFTKEGGYTYNSQALDQNITDTVTYTVIDQFGGTDTGQLSINLGPRFIYVDDDHPTVTPDGRDIHPWKTMQQAQTGSAANDTILVKSGNYTDHIVLQSGQSLIGQGIGANHTHTHNAVIFTVLTAGAAPTISRAAAGDTITLSANNTIRGVAIGSTNGKGIVGNNFTAVTINDNVTVSANGNAALHLDTGAVAATFNSVSASSGANSGLIFNALTGTMNINAGNISNTAGATLNLTGGSMAGTIAANFSTTGSSLINVASRTANAFTLSGALSGSGTIAASGNAAGTTLTFSGTQILSTGGNTGVNLSNNAGTVSFTGGSLQLTSTNGNGFVATGAAAGAINVTGATNTISTLTGIPVQISGGPTIGASGITFRSVAANGAASGIVLSGTGANPFTVAGTGTAGTGGTLQSIVGTAVSLTNTNNVNLNHLTINGASTGIAGATFGTLTLRDLAVTAASGLSLNTGTVSNAPASTAFTSLTTTGGTNGVAMTSVAGTFNVAAGSLSGATGATFLVNGGSVSGTWTTNISQGNAAAVMDISNGHTGALTFPNTISATNGSGLQFSNADGNYQFTGAATLGGGAGIDVLAGSGGTFNWDGDSSISNTTGQLVDIQASAPAFTYSGTFTKTNANIGIRALNNTGGSITFNGTGTKNININSGAANAIDLDNNDNTTISFSGNNLILTTQTGTAFRAVNGGTVSLTGTGNTINSTGGGAVNVADTFITTADLNFQSINTNGGANAITLSNTGTLAANHGGITVTGTGAANSGGTLQNHSGDAIFLSSARDISFTQMNVLTSTGSHIDATNVTNLTLANLDFDLSTDHGILGSNVTAFNANNCTFDRGGAGSGASGKHGIFMTNLKGTSSVTNSTFTRSNTIQFYVTNTTATANQPAASQDILTLSHNTWNQHTGAFGGDHFSLLADGSSNMRLIVNGTGGENKTGGLLAAGSNEGGNAYNIQATGGGKVDSSITAVDAMNVTSGVNIAASSGGINVFDVFSNKSANGTGFASTGIMALNVACINATCNGKFRDNSISHTAPANVNAINAVQEGSGTMTVSIAQNTVSGSFQHGIKVQSRLGTGTTNATINNNTLTQTNNLGLDVINVEAGGSGAGHSNTICLNMHNNSATIAAGGTNAYRVRAWTSCVMNLQDFTGNGANAGDIQTWITTTKSNAGTPVVAQNSGGTFQAAGAACPIP